MVKTFVCIDSNILIRLAGRLVTKSIKGCDPEDWETFQEMVRKGDVVWLVPQVVLMEFEKTVANSGEEFYATSLKLKQKLKQLDDIWNEARDDIRDHLYDQIDQWQRSRPAEWKNEGMRIRKWIQNHTPPIEIITFTPAIWFQAKARLIEGRYPKKTDEKGSPRAREWLQDNDCAIIESLSDYFNRETASKQLLFCTENLEDFGFERPATKRNVLDKRLQPSLPLCEVFLDLGSLVKALKDRQPVEPPQTEEEFEQVLKEKAEEEEEQRTARQMAWLPRSGSYPSLPTPQQVCGQGLQRIHEAYAPEWTQAIAEKDMVVGQNTINAIGGLLVDYVHQQDHFVNHDTRWRQLVELRDKWQKCAASADSTPEYVFWAQGHRLMSELLTLARAFQLAF